jgi:CMP-N-acetylneuraminic acid synthetase
MIRKTVNVPRVSVLMPTYNCGPWIEQAVRSVLDQVYPDWELIVVDDGSKDGTARILDRFTDHPRIRVLFQENRGLAAASQLALKYAGGEYVIRLDADDWFDENILFVLVNILDTHQDYAMVYTDYYLTSEDGSILRQQMRSKINGDKLLDLPALNTGTLIRRRCLMEVGGYTETIRCQDNFDLWIRFIQKYKAYNVNLPLWYYRHRAGSLTTKPDRIFATRRQIKSEFVRRNLPALRVLGIVPVRRLSPIDDNLPFLFLNGKRLIDYTLDESLKVAEIKRLVVTSDNAMLMGYIAERYPQVDCVARAKRLAAPNVGIAPTVFDVLSRYPDQTFDMVALLHAHCPLRRAEHIKEAIDTLLIFDTDSLISVTEDFRTHYQRKENGLTPVVNSCDTLRLERESLYCENGAIFLTKPRHITNTSLLGPRIGHVVMGPDESVAIHNEYDFWLASRIIERNGHAIPETGD